MRRLTARALALVALVAIVVGCTISAPATSTSGPGRTGEASTPAPIPSDIAAMHQVHVDPAAGRSAVIDSTGGTISATGSGGSRFTLTIPPGAIQGAQPIGVFPIQSLGTLPSAAKLIAGVQLSPDGLSFAVPATLTIDLPNPPDAGAGAVGWHGDGDRLDLVPFELEGTTTTLSIYHFSGTGLVVPPGVIAFVSQCAQDDYGCLSQWFEGRFARATSPLSATEVRNVVLNWYLDDIKPMEDQGLLDLAGALADPHPDANETLDILGLMQWHYSVWRADVQLARRWLSDPTFLAAELAHADHSAAAILADTYDVLNAACADVASSDESRALWLANGAMQVHWTAAVWGVDTAANHLDLEYLLDHSCVQVVIDPGRTYTGTAPDSDGAVKVSVGYRIAGGDLKTDPAKIQVSTEITGSQHLFVAFADEAGNYSQDIHWPAGVDPIRIDIHAQLQVTAQGLTFLSDLERFDRITKSTTSRIAFVSSAPGSSRIEVIDSTGGNAVEVTSGPHDTGPRWSPDGSKILFSRFGAGLFTVNPDGSGLQQLLADPGAHAPAWSPDGSRIAFLRPPPGSTNGQVQLALMNADGTSVTDTLVTVVGTHPSWSPDGTRIAYAAGDTDSFTREVLGKTVFYRPYRIYLYDVATGASTKLVTRECEPWGVAAPAWSPDGSRIAVLCATEGPHIPRIGTIPVAGGAFTSLMTAPNGCGGTASWSPDGKSLVVAGACGVHVLTILDLAGGSSGTIGGGADATASDPDWSP